MGKNSGLFSPSWIGEIVSFLWQNRYENMLKKASVTYMRF